MARRKSGAVLQLDPEDGEPAEAAAMPIEGGESQAVVSISGKIELID